VRRIAILLAALAALMLVPAAGAFAANNFSVTIAGEGGGEVSSVGGLIEEGEPTGFLEGSPAIECSYESPGPATGTCENEQAEIEPGIEGIALHAVPDPGSELVLWLNEGGVKLAGTVCRSTEEANLPQHPEQWEHCLLGQESGAGNIELTVVFEPCAEGSEAWTCGAMLNVGVTGDGNVDSEDGGIANCQKYEAADACSELYEPGEEVTLTATPEKGFGFAGWTGCDSESEGKCIVTMGELATSREVEAEFAELPTYPLTLEIKEGEGTVVSDPAGIECTGPAGEECTSEFEEGQEVTLTASPAAGYRFFSWGLCPSANGRQCTVTMSEATEVRAKFKKTYNLTIDKGGSQRGVVLNSKNGVTCAVRCSTSTISLFEGAEVTIYTATPFGNTYMKEFTAGTGSTASCDGTAECTFTLEEDSSAEALFEERPKATLSIEKEGGGEAKLEGNGTFCNNSCESQQVEYFSAPTAQEAVIAWELNAGTSSIEWTTGAGTCTGSSEETKGQCKVTMDEAHELVAKLE